MHRDFFNLQHQDGQYQDQPKRIQNYVLTLKKKVFKNVFEGMRMGKELKLFHFHKRI